MTDELKEPYFGAFTEPTTQLDREQTPWAVGNVWPNATTVNDWLREQGGLRLSPALERHRARIQAALDAVRVYNERRDANMAAIIEAHQASLTGTPEQRKKNHFKDWLDHAAYAERVVKILNGDPDAA